MPLYGLFGTKPTGTLEFGGVFARFEGDDPVSALKAHMIASEVDAGEMLEENFESFGRPYHYTALLCMDRPELTILKVAPDPGTGEIDVTIANPEA